MLSTFHVPGALLSTLYDFIYSSQWSLALDGWVLVNLDAQPKDNKDKEEF